MLFQLHGKGGGFVHRGSLLKEVPMLAPPPDKKEPPPGGEGVPCCRQLVVAGWSDQATRPG